MFQDPFRAQLKFSQDTPLTTKLYTEDLRKKFVAKYPIYPSADAYKALMCNQRAYQFNLQYEDSFALALMLVEAATSFPTCTLYLPRG